MKNLTQKLNIGLFFCAILVFTGCNNEEYSDTELENVAVKNIGQKRDCGTCSSTKYPGSSRLFKAALKKMDLEYHWDSGSSQDNNANPHTAGACDTEYFTRCDSQMVLSSTGDINDRTELKLVAEHNQSINDYSQMRFVAQVTDIPSSSNENKVNKGVTIAQIHNRGTNVKRPLARVDIAGNRKKVRVTFAHGYRKSDGQTSIDLVNYNEGDNIFVRLRIKPRGNAIQVYVANNTLDEKKGGTWTIPSDSNWNNRSDTYYYKTGVYQQLGGASPSISYNYLYFDSL